MKSTTEMDRGRPRMRALLLAAVGSIPLACGGVDESEQPASRADAACTWSGDHLEKVYGTFASGVVGTVAELTRSGDVRCYETTALAPRSRGSARVVAKRADGTIAGSSEVRSGAFGIALEPGEYRLTFEYEGTPQVDVTVGPRAPQHVEFIYGYPKPLGWPVFPPRLDPNREDCSLEKSLCFDADEIDECAAFSTGVIGRYEVAVYTGNGPVCGINGPGVAHVRFADILIERDDGVQIWTRAVNGAIAIPLAPGRYRIAYVASGPGPYLPPWDPSSSEGEGWAAFDVTPGARPFFTIRVFCHHGGCFAQPVRE